LKQNVLSFLESKPLYSKEVDFTFFPRFFERYAGFFKLPRTIHIVGTNGKGSSGRFLSYLLKNCGFVVGHYTSPHILSFNERIWIDGENISDCKLQELHIELLGILGEDADKLSYFEYTTLLAFLAFRGVEFAIIEAGLGGEFDATNVVEKELLLVTKIDYDHTDFLGSKIEDIARTKLNAISKKALIANQTHHIVLEIAKEIGEIKKAQIFNVEELLEPVIKDEIDIFVTKEYLPRFQIENLSNAVASMKLLGLGDRIRLENIYPPMGRAQRLNSSITLDVGHNTMAARALLDEFAGKKVVLIYNSMKDKDYKTILEILRPIIKRVEVLELRFDRALDIEVLKGYLKGCDIPYADFKKIESDEEYLVFGSFYTVERFLKIYKGEGGF